MWFDQDAPLVDNYPSVVQQLLCNPVTLAQDFSVSCYRRELSPAPGYDKLAEFLHLQLVHTVLTTNFDSVLLMDMRAQKGRPHISSMPSRRIPDYTKFTTDPQYPQLVYLHGSVDHYTDKNLIDEVQRLDQAADQHASAAA